MHVGIKLGIAALGAGAVGAFGGKVVGADGDDRLAGLGIAGAGAAIGSTAAIISGAPKWSAAIVTAAAGVGYLLGATLFGGAGEGVKHLAPGLPQNEQEWAEAVDRSGIGKPFTIPDREVVPTDPRL
jgi:hypothetical protein